jgi:MFS family permease
LSERNGQTAFRGWLIVGIAAVSQALAVGTTFFSYGVFVKPLAAEFEAPRLVVILGMTLVMLVQGIVSPGLGRLLDGRSIRTVMTLGAAICATGFLGLSFATALWQVGLLVGTLIAVGSHMFGPLATSTLIANWFQQMRGRALGITAIGASIGGLILPVVATRLLEEFGWRGALSVFAVLLALFALPLWLLVIDRPERIGQRPDGMPSDTATPQAGVLGRDVRRESTGDPEAEVRAQGSVERDEEGGAQEPLLRSRNFWVITAAIGMAFCSTSTLIAHLVPYATDLGHDPQSAAFLMSAYAGSGAVGRLLCGFLADRIDKRFASWVVFGILTSGWSALVVAPSYPALLVASVGMGLGVGGIMPLWGALTGACFGRARFGQAMGLMTPLMLPFNLLGAPIAAYAFDQTGSYSLVLSAFLATFFIGAAIIALLRIPAVEPGAAS